MSPQAGYAIQPSVPNGNVGAGLSENDKLVATLVEELDALENRFTHMLLPAGPPMPPGHSGQSGPVAVPAKSGMATQIEELNVRLSGCINRVRQLTSRADL